MLTIENLNTILNTKYGVIDQWELIDIKDYDWDDEYKFQFYKRLIPGHGQYEDMILNRVGKSMLLKGKQKMVYKFGDGLFTTDYLRDKSNFKGIIEKYLKTK
jgi:hypothetical protein